MEALTRNGVLAGVEGLEPPACWFEVMGCICKPSVSSFVSIALLQLGGICLSLKKNPCGANQVGF